MRAILLNVFAFVVSLFLAAVVAYRVDDTWFGATHSRAAMVRNVIILVLGVAVGARVILKSQWPVQKKEPAVMALAGVALGVAGVAWYALKVWNYSGRG